MEKRVRILLVDDNKNFCETIADVLTMEGFDMFLAYNGEEAIKKAQEVSPDLIVIDVMMPGMNGFELCENVRSDIELKNLPVIMMTGYDSKDNKLKSYYSGTSAYLVKPFNVKDLIVKIRELLEPE